MATLLEVRCCYQPKKLLGWLLVRRSNAAFVRCQLRGQLGDLAIRTVELPIAEINTGHRRFRAVKAEGAPIEMLRRIVGFTEAEPGHHPAPSSESC